MLQTFFAAVSAAALAYAEYVKWLREKEIDNIEDEMDRLASIGDPASKLRLERLAKRKQRKIESVRTV